MTNLPVDPIAAIEHSIDAVTKKRTLRWGEHELTANDCVDYREGLIELRNGSLEAGSMDWAVYISHMIVSWGMMCKLVFGAEYDRALSLAEASKKSQAEPAAAEAPAGDIRNDSEGGEPTTNTPVQGDAAGDGRDGRDSADTDR